MPKSLEEMSIQELKATAYDQLAQMELQKNLLKQMEANFARIEKILEAKFKELEKSEKKKAKTAA